VVALVVLLLTVLTAVGFWFRADVRADRAVAQSGEVVQDALSQAITAAEGRLAAAAALFRASEDVTQVEFAQFVADVGLIDGMGGVGYIALVPVEGLDAFVSETSDQIPGYRVFERDLDGSRIPIGSRPLYYPVKWFEPGAAFDRPHGFDSGSDPVRLSALQRAAEEDVTVITPFLRLLSEDDDDGFAMYRRVVDLDTGMVVGFTVVPMDLSELLASRIPDSVAETVAWKVADVTDAPVTSDTIDGIGGGWVAQLAVDGRLWEIEVTTREGSPLAADAEATVLVLLGGLVVSLSAATVAYLLYRRSETNRELQHLRDLTSAKDRFLASVSHELRTPLTGVLGFAELLRDDDGSLTPPERAEMIRRVADQAFDLGHIIEDLLVSARAELNQLSIAKVPVCPQAQVAQVIESYGPDLASRVTVIDQLPPSLRAAGDPGRIRQIIRNLINNAWRYGGPRIEVRIDETDQIIRVEVADNGPPMPADAHARIFEPYQRAHGAAGQPESVGIGLSISRTLARLMGGEVEYRRSDGWNVFELSLPPSGVVSVPLTASIATN
jgi:signal transduction histidine kinase